MIIAAIIIIVIVVIALQGCNNNPKPPEDIPITFNGATISKWNTAEITKLNGVE